MITKVWAAPEVEQIYLRTAELSQQCGAATQRFLALHGLYGLALLRGKLAAAREREKQLLSFAQQQQNPTLLLEARYACWSTALSRGELAAAQAHIEKGLDVYHLQLHRAKARVFSAEHDPVLCGLTWRSLTFWLEGYPAQALRNMDRAFALGRDLGHPVTVALSLAWAAQLHQFLRDGPATREKAEASVSLAAEEGFPYVLSWGLVLRGWALAEHGQAE